MPTLEKLNLTACESICVLETSCAGKHLSPSEKTCHEREDRSRGVCEATYRSRRTHDRRRLLCQVSQTLPSAFYRALGKEAVCRVLERKHSANKQVVCQVPNTRQRITLDKDQVCRVSNNNTRQRATAVNSQQPSLILCRVSAPNTRQRGSFAECHFLTLGKPYFFKLLTSKTFSAVLRQYLVLHVPMWHIFWTFSIFL